MKSKDVPNIELIEGPMPQSQCNSCKHFEGYSICPAFPGGIPVSVITNEVLHSEPLEDQEGDVTYQPKK